MGFYDDVKDAMGRDTGLRTVANIGRQAMGDTSWRQRPQALDYEDAKAYAAQPQGVSGRSTYAPEQQSGLDKAQSASDLADRMQQKYFKGVEGPQRELPQLSSGMRDPALEGKKIYNYYDPDHPVDQEKNAKAVWSDMARQLANFSRLRQMDQPAMTGDRATDMANLRHRHDMEKGSMLADREMDKTRFAGENSIQLEGLRGRNQLSNTGLGYTMQGLNQAAHDRRAYDQAIDLEGVKQSNPYYASAAEENKAKARLYGIQSDAAQRGLDFENTEQGQLAKFTDSISKAVQSGLYTPEEGQRMLKEQRAYLGYLKQKKQSQAGYADGGKVDPEELMRQMTAKYGAPAAGPVRQQPAPQPVQAPQQPAPVQQSPSGLDRIRAYGQGNGLEQRMRAAGAYAQGGPVAVGGRQVVGEGDGKSDSLPAMIDDEHPAALSTGEFVMPVEAVQHFGLAKLNKMVEQARKGLDTGR